MPGQVLPYRAFLCFVFLIDATFFIWLLVFGIGFAQLGEFISFLVKRNRTKETRPSSQALHKNR